MLRAAGLELLERNFRCRGGEIDLVMNERGILVFVEVRQRRSPAFGDAAESVTRGKQRKLLTAAAVYVARNPSWQPRPARFDVVCIDGESITWLNNAFEAP
jgi:putative endonuclease